MNLTRAPRAHEVLPSSTQLDPLTTRESPSNLVALRASNLPYSPPQSHQARCSQSTPQEVPCLHRHPLAVPNVLRSAQRARTNACACPRHYDTHRCLDTVTVSWCLRASPLLKELHTQLLNYYRSYITCHDRQSREKQTPSFTSCATLHRTCIQHRLTCACRRKSRVSSDTFLLQGATQH